MLKLITFFLITQAGLAFSTHLVTYRSTETNEIQEEVLEFRFEDSHKEVLHLKVPKRWVDAEAWSQGGALQLRWDNCTTDEMLEKRGELTQCIRRAFLSLHGEADSNEPATLRLQVLKDGRISVHYETRFNPKADFSFVARIPKKLNAWNEFLETLSLDSLPAKTPFQKIRTQGRTNELPVGGSSQGKYEDRNVGFLVFGDSGTGGTPQYQVAAGIKTFCEARACEFVTLLGDNIYEAGVGSVADSQWQSKFEKPYKDLSMPFYPALGNHDHGGNIQAQIDYSEKSNKWKMPGRYYHYIKGNLDFFVIDSDDFDSDQRKWLEGAIATAKGRWKLVYGHHPVYSYGSHGHSERLIQNLLPILTKYKVDFYLSGHDHDKQVLQDSGVAFIVSGASAKLRPVKSGSKSIYNSSTYGFAHMACDNEKCDLSVLDQEGKPQYQKTYQKPAKRVSE